jgi:hypothetical protein
MTMKSKFQNLDFGSVEVLSQEQQNKVKGGYIPASGGGGDANSCPSKYCYATNLNDTIWPPKPSVPTKCNSSSLSSKKDNCLWVCPLPSGGSCW